MPLPVGQLPSVQRGARPGSQRRKTSIAAFAALRPTKDIDLGGLSEYPALCV